ncbi:hypothetical protein [Serratia proteamaculans]|uniref:hypothetical protein n=1 Tax=Serratia proteamaculans TaxID=28151 RepID=UPI000E6BD33A
MGQVKTRRQIQYRLSEDLENALEVMAAKRGLSANEYAKKVMVAELNGSGTSGFKADTSIKHTLTTTYILVNSIIFQIMASNPSLTEDQAKEIAHTNIFSKANEHTKKILTLLGIEE